MTGPVLSSPQPYLARDGWGGRLGPIRTGERPWKRVTIRLDGDELVLRDTRRRDIRVPTARRDPAAGVLTLMVLGNAYQQTPTPPEQAYKDYLVGLTKSGNRVFSTELGWPVETVRAFAAQAGLRWGGQRDFLEPGDLGRAYPMAAGGVRLRSMHLAYRWFWIGMIALGALGLVATIVVQIAVAAT